MEKKGKQHETTNETVVQSKIKKKSLCDDAQRKKTVK